MTTLQVHITAGPQAGARLQLNQSPVTFGRSPDNTLVIDVNVVSRQHGELRIEDGRWVLINLSQNGTRVGRKKVTKKPFPLTDGVPIVIGDTEVFRVHLIDGGPADEAPAREDPETTQPAAPPPGAGLKGRSKLWVLLGVWMLFCLGLFVFFATLKSPTDNSTAAELYLPASQEEIRELLAEPLKPQDPSDARYADYVSRARSAYNDGDAGLYPAYDNYQRAASYRPRGAEPLEPADVQKYQDVLDRLSREIYNTYTDAFRRNKAGQHETAANMIDQLQRSRYPNTDPNDPLGNHLRRLYERASAGRS